MLSAHLPACRSALRRFLRDRRGNVMMIMGFALLPLVFAVGMGIDYSRAMRTQTRLNAAADAAALSAVTTPMMSQSGVAACTLARKMFIAQMNGYGMEGLVLDANQPTITIVDTNSSGVATSSNCTGGGGGGAAAASFARTVTVSYRGQSTNVFASILRIPTLTIKGTSAANAAVAPNIDFYVMMDTSQSMLLPATSSGLAAMIAATPNEGGGTGCAFACHQSWRGTGATQPDGGSSEIQWNPIDPMDNTKRLDNYAVARNLGIVLRTDLVTGAVQNLTDVATSTSAQNHAQYRMGLASFDFAYNAVWPTSGTPRVDSSLARVKTHVTDATVSPYYFNNWRTSSNNDGDRGTATSTAMTTALTVLPLAPGTGTNNAGDTPQAMLFIISDGMRDEFRATGIPEGPIDTTLCDTVKARGIRIAVLYTQYLPASASDGWSRTNVLPKLSPTDTVGAALSSCASTGLFYQVTTDSDISTALALLFQKAVATAHLTQ